MTPFVLSFVMLALLLVMLVLRIPIGVAMFVTGAIGYVSVSGWEPLMNHLKSNPYHYFSTYSLSVIPLFVLMGEFATRAGMSRALFTAANAWVGHRRGGMAMAAIGGSAGFGSICGSSLATAATMTQVALPEMRRYGYSGALATGSLAAGGTLGILIPPSVILVLYAIMTEQSIGQMFVAAVVPAAIAVAGYLIAVQISCYLDPDAGPAGARMPLIDRFRTLRSVWPVALIFILIIFGIYGGWFTPTEGAAIGAFGTGVLAVTLGGMRTTEFLDCIYGTARITAMIFLILLGADLLNAFLGLTRMPTEAAMMIVEMGLSPMAVLLAILAIYLVMGCLMDSMSMLVLSIPIFFPIVMSLDLGMAPQDQAVWFGIIALIVVEMGLITPPVGMNVFVINGMARDIPIIESYKGVLPFLAMDVVRVLILVLFPGIVLWLGSVL
ncbi:MAG: TRAP transporter large permease [Aquisalimonadaceae bacterium]